MAACKESNFERKMIYAIQTVKHNVSHWKEEEKTGVLIHSKIHHFFNRHQRQVVMIFIRCETLTNGRRTVSGFEMPVDEFRSVDFDAFYEHCCIQFAKEEEKRFKNFKQKLESQVLLLENKLSSFPLTFSYSKQASST